MPAYTWYCQDFWRIYREGSGEVHGRWRRGSGNVWVKIPISRLYLPEPSGRWYTKPVDTLPGVRWSPPPSASSREIVCVWLPVTDQAHITPGGGLHPTQ